MKSLSLFCVLSCTLAATATAGPRTIFLVRHAERARMSAAATSDTDLSAAGRARAQSLADALKDAKITAIYTSEFARTQETAAPLAHSLGIRPEVVFADETTTLIAKLKASHGNTLVVGHSNTLRPIIRGLGIFSRVTINESDYDNLFLIVLDPAPHLIHLHFR